MKYVGCLVCEKLFEVSSRYSQKKYCSSKCGNLARGRRWYRNNPDKVLLKRKTESLDWAKRACSRLKYTAKIRDIPFDIEPQDLVIPEICPVLGISIERSVGAGSGYWSNNPSVDKIKPELGYVRGM